MVRPMKDTRLDVAGLLAHGSLRGTTALYLTPASAVIESVVLVSQLEAIQRVRPNTVVVLSAEMGSGGWLVSAALRHAWERRASAVVVAGSTYSSAVIGLAERLGITLLASEGNPAGVALALAAEIGAALSVVDAELARFARAVAKDSTLTDVLSTISGELDGVGVSLEYDGVVLASAGMDPRDQAEVITVDVGAANAAVPSALTARVPASGVHNLRLVRSILEVAAPSVKAAWLMGDSRDAARAVPTAALAGLNQSRGSSGATFEEDHRHLLSQLGWRRHERYVAVWICHGDSNTSGPDLTAVLRLLWRKVAARSPLAKVDGGWLALVPAAHESVVAQLELRLKTRLRPALAELGLVAGLSRWVEEAPPLPSVIQEARLAAVSAQSAGQGTVLGFAGLGVAAATAFVDQDAVALVAELTLPRLMTSPDRDAIVAAAAAFLDHRSSVSLAAAALDVHRNTLQARLGRARELGVPLDNPSELLSVHLILNVLRAAAHEKQTFKDPHETRKDSHEFPV
ncbi:MULTISPECIES: helix-turn-helix domain-containing protein [Micrococcaceae]|uniref:helix-turn-helix domain-containing protein n=1 Tax=Micrococcaceae TaxID=1268 RepID=UPI001F1D319B|nr:MULTISPECIES: helix-turn-helix domain-containing protein [Micrococcaceae]UKA75259.1 helix-turn-helix domain-containing protein [Arthrobacter sp. FW306-07-I]